MKEYRLPKTARFIEVVSVGVRWVRMGLKVGLGEV